MMERRFVMSVRAPHHHPDQQAHDAKNHGKGVVEQIARLHAGRRAGQPWDNTHGDAVDGAVDNLAVTLFPEHVAQPERRANEDKVVDLVEIPLVEQELIKHPLLRGQTGRHAWISDIEEERDEQAQKHGDEVVAGFIVERMTYHRKTIWMLKSSQK